MTCGPDRIWPLRVFLKQAQRCLCYFSRYSQRGAVTFPPEGLARWIVWHGSNRFLFLIIAWRYLKKKKNIYSIRITEVLLTVEHDVTRQLSSHIYALQSFSGWKAMASMPESFTIIYVIISNRKRQYPSVSGCEKWDKILRLLLLFCWFSGKSRTWKFRVYSQCIPRFISPIGFNSMNWPTETKKGII